jgi:hypothetical protein
LAFHSGREADNSPGSSAEVKEWVEVYSHSPTTPSWCGTQLPYCWLYTKRCRANFVLVRASQWALL